MVLVASAIVGCWLGRWAGPRLRLCPYVLSAQAAAAAPIGVGLMSQDLRLGVVSLLVGLGAAVGTFMSGHSSRLLAVFLAGLGAALGAGLGDAFV